jgi:phosphatidate cytidylyltransferase
MITAERFFDPAGAFENPATLGMVVGIAVVIVLSAVIILGLQLAGRLSPELYRELRQRCTTWVVIYLVFLAFILSGPGMTMLLGLALCLLCYREYARATGIFREKALSIVVLIGILFIHFAAIDNYYRLFVATWPLTTSIIVAAALIPDRPDGYIQRVALAILGFIMFGIWLGHFAFLANDLNYRPILLWLLVGVEFNDVAAYLCGRLFGRRKLCPNTSPNKTVAGAVGAVLITTPLVAVIGHYVFLGQPMDTFWNLATLGLAVSIPGQYGDLMLSSIKRDLGIKDMAATLPGHGGLLDRFDSLLLVMPLVFHFINYVQGIAPGVPANLISGPFGNP